MRVSCMKKGSFGTYLATFLVVIGIFYIIGAIGEASEPKCIKAGCDNKQASGSSYSTKGHSSSNKSNPYASYDSGYDSIYDDGDYDWNRYQKDRDYADGVDDAMEELDEDW